MTIRETSLGVVVAGCATEAEATVDGANVDTLSARGVLRGRLVACWASSMPVGS
jgi:hypothetical protein